MLFVGYLINKKRKSTTIRSYVCAIKTVLKVENIEINEDQYLLGSLVKACQYKNDHIMHKLPIHKYMLTLIINYCTRHFESKGQSYLAVLYAAIFSTAFYGLLRIGEIALYSHAINAPDVQIGLNKKKIRMLLRTSKTHWKDKKPQIIKIRALQKPTNQSKKCKLKCHCPFELLQNYAKL